MTLDQSGKTAKLYRMVMPDHLCPYGLKSKDLVKRQGFTVEDHHLKTRDETEAFKTGRHRHSSATSGSAATTTFVSISGKRCSRRTRRVTSR